MSVKSVLTTYGQIGVDLLRDAVAPHDATGKTRASIRFELKAENLLFYARQFFSLLEKGIGPSTKKPSKEMIESMTEYAEARGFSDPEKAAWAISINQLKHGDKTKLAGGRVVYSDQVEQLTKSLSEDLAKDYGKTILGEIKKQFK
jgi:hypothetical protein